MTEYSMRKRLIGATLVAMAALMQLAPAGAHAVENDPGFWTVFSTTDAFQSGGEDSRWLYWFDAQARYFDIGSGVNQWLARPFVGYQVTDDFKVWLGYARFRTRGRTGSVVDENRFIQQVDWRIRDWHDGTLSFRARLLERSVDVGDDTGLRLRTMAKYVRPMANGRTFILSVEPFFDLNNTDWGGRGGIKQNRVYVGTGWRVNDNWSIDAGYMNQYLFVETAANRSNHLGVLNFKASF